jgi:uncharacterized protein
MPAGELALMVAAALIGWKVAERVGLFGASILGPMILDGGIVADRHDPQPPPAEAILVAQLFIGLAIGVHYVGVTFRELARVRAVGVGFRGDAGSVWPRSLPRSSR